MKYVTWLLNWNDLDYGTGPEESARGSIIAGPALGEVTDGARVLGYADDSVDPVEFEPWSMIELTQDQALLLARDLDADAFLRENGRIGFPLPPMPMV